MSLRPQEIAPVPAETVRVARAAFPKGTRYLRLRDELGTIYEDALFAPLFPSHGQPAEAPWRLALITVLQFAEGLPDRQAADAVRGRLDWKYLLGLELTDPGFHYSVLSEFRDRLVQGSAEQLLLDALLERCKAVGLVKARGKQRTDSTGVLAAVRALNRLTCVGETLRHALNILAEVVPDWLRAHSVPAWFERYAVRIEEARLPQAPTERDEMAATIGADGVQLLLALYAPTAPLWLREIPAVQILRQIWVQYFYAPAESDGRMRLRSSSDMPPETLTLETPYDPDARFHIKRGHSWTGYTVHLTETCDEDTPHLITQVATTPAATQDVEMTADIHTALAARDLLPAEHFTDTGYVSARHLVASTADHGVELVCPAPPDTSWQTRMAQGFDVLSFAVDWEAKTVTCPQGQHSQQWYTSINEHGKPVNQIVFNKRDCLPCPCRSQCTRSQHNARTIVLRPREEHAALQEARQRQTTTEFKERYHTRAGIEGTISQGTHRGLRRSRYRGLQKTGLQHIATGVAISLQRLDDWWTDTPRARTRTSRFAALAS